MRSAVAGLLLLAAIGAAEPPVPAPQGWVTDLAGVLDASTTTRVTRLIEELQARTGAEIAVVTVRSTAPLDDFTYAMKIADAWRPGRKKEDTGVVFLLAISDRKLRILVGYGLEGILPDGLVGQIEDEEIVPSLKAGRIDEAVWQGVAALASRIAASRGVTLTGVPPPRARAAPGLPPWAVVVLLLLFVAVFGALVLYRPGPGVRRRRGRYIPGGSWPGGFGDYGGGDFGGGGGGGFGGFGGGGFGGGGAGRSW